MGTTSTLEKTQGELKDATRAVAEYLLCQEANIATLARVLERDPRTVYRALRELKEHPGWRVKRWGEHGDYVYEVEQVSVSAA